MNAAHLSSLAAEDIMQHDVITVSAGNTLRDALALMTENHIGGLPVMDRRSRCVGLIAATDILNYEQEHSDEIAEGNEESTEFYDQESERWETIRLSSFALEHIGDVLVSEMMTRDLVAVAKQTPISEVAKTMHEARVHRVVVLGEENQLFGIISALDFVKCFAELED